MQSCEVLEQVVQSGITELWSIKLCDSYATKLSTDEEADLRNTRWCRLQFCLSIPAMLAFKRRNRLSSNSVDSKARKTLE